MIRDLIIETIVSEINNATMFSVMLNTTQDISVDDQCAIVVRYVTDQVWETWWGWKYAMPREGKSNVWNVIKLYKQDWLAYQKCHWKYSWWGCRHPRPIQWIHDLFNECVTRANKSLVFGTKGMDVSKSHQMVMKTIASLEEISPNFTDVKDEAVSFAAWANEELERHDAR